MATIAHPTLQKEDHVRDAEFNKVLHGASAEKRGGMMAMLKKDPASQKAAVEEYFKHWDNKTAEVETEETRKARRDEYATLTKQLVSLIVCALLSSS
jgi:sterol 24-C-methyltransferase